MLTVRKWKSGHCVSDALLQRFYMKEMEVCRRCFAPSLVLERSENGGGNRGGRLLQMHILIGQDTMDKIGLSGVVRVCGSRGM